VRKTAVSRCPRDPRTGRAVGLPQFPGVNLAQNLGAAGTFQGVININGQEMRFDNQAEFEAAKKQLLGK